MNRDNEKQSEIILALLGIIPIVWISLLIAPFISEGLLGLFSKLGDIFDNPFSIALCKDSLKTVLIFLMIYGIGIGIYFSTKRNYRRKEEHGSAKWGNAKTIDKKYKQRPPSENKLMTQNVSIGLDAKNIEGILILLFVVDLVLVKQDSFVSQI